jgi:hypothetical protein
VRINIYIVNQYCSTEWDAKWEVSYRADVVVTDLGAGGRILEASAGNAMVDLYGPIVTNRPGPPKARQPAATFQLPFKLTLTPMLAP